MIVIKILPLLGIALAMVAAAVGSTIRAIRDLIRRSGPGAPRRTKVAITVNGSALSLTPEEEQRVAEDVLARRQD
jgi:hypothetical protein